jgi:hypothetical protein
MNTATLVSELYLPYGVPVVKQLDAEKGRTVNPRAINVGPFIVIRQTECITRTDIRVRKIQCRKCPSMVGGEALQENHWTVYAPNLPDALIKAGAHIEACHTNGSSDEL